MRSKTDKGKWSVKKIILLSLLLVISLSCVFVYRNFNKLLSKALMKAYESNVISDVYDLKFEDLSYNIFDRNIHVGKVRMQVKQNYSESYPYINSTFKLSMEELELLNVRIYQLIKTGALEIDGISIIKPDIELVVNANEYVFFPNTDSTALKQKKKKPLDSIRLNAFQLTHAGLHITNLRKQRVFNIDDLNASLSDLGIGKHQGKGFLSFNDLKFSLGSFTGNLNSDKLKQFNLKDLTLNVDSLTATRSAGRLVCSLNEFKTNWSDLEIQLNENDSTDSRAKKENFYSIKNFSLSLLELKLDQGERKERISVEEVVFSSGMCSTNLNSNVLKQTGFEACNLRMNSMVASRESDTLNCHVSTVNIESNGLHVLVSDSATKDEAKAKRRVFNVRDLNLNLTGLDLRKVNKEELVSVKDMKLSLDTFAGKMEHAKLKQINFERFDFHLESMLAKGRKDSMNYTYKDFNANLKRLDFHTADSVFHVSFQKMVASYKAQHLSIKDLRVKPNVSDDQLQRRFRFQNPQFYGAIGSLDMSKINFEVLLNKRRLVIDKVALDQVAVTGYKDQLKPIDPDRYPEYIGQQLNSIHFPILIRSLFASHVSLINKERKKDKSIARLVIDQGTLHASNITSQPSAEPLVMSADATLDGVAHFNVEVKFSYMKPQFHFAAIIPKLDLTKLNPLISGYTPITVTKGILDELSFSGVAEQTGAKANMQFLYHDLSVVINDKAKADWKNSLISFAANKTLPAANPATSKRSPRIVQYTIDRNRNKGFLNVILKSLFRGINETLTLVDQNLNIHPDDLKKVKIRKRKK